MTELLGGNKTKHLIPYREECVCVGGGGGGGAKEMTKQQIQRVCKPQHNISGERKSKLCLHHYLPDHSLPPLHTSCYKLVFMSRDVLLTKFVVTKTCKICSQLHHQLNDISIVAWDLAINAGHTHSLLSSNLARGMQ